MTQQNGNGIRFNYSTFLQIIFGILAVGIGWGVNRAEIRHLKIQIDYVEKKLESCNCVQK